MTTNETGREIRETSEKTVSRPFADFAASPEASA